jgi:hypothetical protein
VPYQEDTKDTKVHQEFWKNGKDLCVSSKEFTDKESK